ncbi:MAG TPA: GvpL/GvpF family gas vesicle protein [Candidatus Limnocylindria bacterium]|nr:GvpL/GvpF family gas vesicle protein [Candidatus Limnocylindria bacterium]
MTVAKPLGDQPVAEGIYVYCIIESAGPRSLGKIGIGGRADDVFTVLHRELAAVVSRTPLMVYDPTRENALTHEHVNEVVMIDSGFTPVPMSFGTLFKTEDDIVEFLKDTYDALRDVLRTMKDKLEFGLKVNWDRNTVLADIERDCEEIRRSKASTGIRRTSRGCSSAASWSRRSRSGPRCSSVRSTTSCASPRSRRARTRLSGTG